MVSTEKICRAVQSTFTLLVETIPIHFCWLTCWKQKLVQSKTLQQGLVLISDFWQFRHSNFNSGESNLKLHWENWHGRGVRFNEPVQVQKGRKHHYIEWMWNNNKKRTDSSCVYMPPKSTRRWRAWTHKMIRKWQVKNKQIKRKQTCSLRFVSVFKFQENKFKIVQRNF